jgi:hypothetical protein
LNIWGWLAEPYPAAEGAAGVYFRGGIDHQAGIFVFWTGRSPNYDEIRYNNFAVGMLQVLVTQNLDLRHPSLLFPFPGRVYYLLEGGCA